MLLVGCNHAVPSDFVGTSQICHLRLESTFVAQADLLFVVDNSAAMGPWQNRITTEIAKVIDDNLAKYAPGPDVSYRFGVITADGATTLRSGCGIAGDRPFVEYERGLVNTLEPGVTVGTAVACLAAAGSNGPDAQQPLATAARFLTGNLAANGGFRRDYPALPVVIFIVGADYSEELGPWVDAIHPDPYLDAEAVAPSGLTAESTLMRALAASPYPYRDAPIALDEPNWQHLWDWVPLFVAELAVPCLVSLPRDPAHPDFVVEDVTRDADGESHITEIAQCSDEVWHATCWRMVSNDRCVSGLSMTVDRPLGTVGNIQTQVAYDCAVTAPMESAP